jgi:GNAT superfamily N-acetyltransferase
MRDEYRREMNCQIVHDSYHQRGFTDSYAFTAGADVIGYASLAGDDGKRDVIKEFYVRAPWRDLSTAFFRRLVEHSKAVLAEAQTNDPFLWPIVRSEAAELTSDTILFADALTTSLAAGPGVLRRLSWRDRRKVFPHVVEPVGDWGVDVDGEVVATGGLLFHYNKPYGDIYMEVASPHRRRGFGSFLVQELKRIAYDGGHVPAARCNTDNLPSQRALHRAGMHPCGQIMRGRLAA